MVTLGAPIAPAPNTGNMLAPSTIDTFSAVAGLGISCGALGFAIGLVRVLVTLNCVGIAMCYPYSVGATGTNGASPVAGVGVSIAPSFCGVRALGGVGVNAGCGVSDILAPCYIEIIAVAGLVVYGIY